MPFKISLSIPGKHIASHFNFVANTRDEVNRIGTRILRSYAERKGVSIHAVDYEIQKAA